MAAVEDAEVTSVVTVKADESPPARTTAVAKIDDPVPAKKPPLDLKTMSSARFAELAVASGAFKDTDVAKAMVKIRFGMALGIDEATALSSIIISQGKISFTANFIAARVKSSGKYRYDVVEKTDKKCRLQFFEKVEEYTDDGKLIFRWHRPGPPEEFSWEMAEKAGLPAQNPTWKKYAASMLFCRCLTAGSRTYCPEVFCGVSCYTPDELDPSLPVTVTAEGDVVVDAEVVEGSAAKSKPAKKPLTAAAAAPTSPLDRVRRLLRDTATDDAKFLGFYKKSKVEDLSEKELASAEELLQKKARAK